MSANKYDKDYLYVDVKGNAQTGKRETQLYEDITESELSNVYESDKRASITEGYATVDDECASTSGFPKPILTNSVHNVPNDTLARKTPKRWIMILIIIALCFGSMVIAAGLTSAYFLQISTTASGMAKLIFYA